MDDWEKLNEKSLSQKEELYSHLNMEETTDAYYTHAKRVCRNFKIKPLGEFIFTTNLFIILKHISDVSSELHSLSSFHLYSIIHKNSYFCQGGYRDKLQ